MNKNLLPMFAGPSALSRRRFLAFSGATLGMAIAGCSKSGDAPVAESAPVAPAVPSRKLEKIGIELYTVRKQMEQSVQQTLERIAQIGYDEVEFAGYFKSKPSEVKKYLADTGLKSYSAHVFLEALRDKTSQTLDEVAEVGHQYVVLGYGVDNLKTQDECHRHIEWLRQMGEAAKQRGLQFGYHNHAFEFKSVDGIVPYDLMLADVDSDLMKMTMDFFWIHYAGVDPYPYFDKYPGRFKQCHVKDMTADRKMADAGAGTLDFAKLFAQRDQAGLEHFYVERDDAPEPYETAAASLAYLRALRF
ncbi:sugar phosphate isomerase/epimerase family protein [Steroidobacter sp.]|uniref:sugar phosphate isomerase/epimerase family protein n=1 Tax=Steroidobacter sp. TaxID=1978227 RepID=UPI001A57C9C2|nr:TIM barrel protein [Steroidobacter sp.]MBL8264970.1 TIM barrel protein [Steroidobacter sp.]